MQTASTHRISHFVSVDAEASLESQWTFVRGQQRIQDGFSAMDISLGV